MSCIVKVRGGGIRPYVSHYGTLKRLQSISNFTSEEESNLLMHGSADGCRRTFFAPRKDGGLLGLQLTHGWSGIISPGWIVGSFSVYLLIVLITNI